jgi:hypothetical protein
MGTIRFTGENGESGLYDHEGNVQAEIDIDDPMRPGRRWISYFSGAVADHFTGRYRAACECGWEGPVIDFTTWDEPEFDCRRGYLSEAHEDAVLTAWEAHTDPLLADLEHGAPLAAVGAALREVEDRVRAEVRRAIAAGFTSDQVARHLGHTSATIAARQYLPLRRS